MTCIVAICHEGSIYMGADSAGVAGYHLTQRKDKKIFKVDDMIIGFTSSFRMGQILMYSLKRPYHPHGMDDHKYMSTIFVDEIRSLFDKNGFKRVDANVDSGGVFIVGYKKKIYKIESDFQVGVSIDNFQSCGCGEELALGSLNSTKGKYPVERIRMALKTAEKYSAGVRGPFLVEQI